jgi:anti-sigma regulatory factor (Ser/Thr protein kinase)/serine/threonine protein phosphatase PrpC
VQPEKPDILLISHPTDIHHAQRVARTVAAAVGFDGRAVEEVAIAAGELASNLIKHAGGGELRLTRLADYGRFGMQLESIDRGPGIPDVEHAMADGFSTAGGIGYGLGAINRLMDEVDVRPGANRGTHIIGKRWVRAPARAAQPYPLEVGAATRAHLGMAVNGDAFVIKHWGDSALVAVIDGLGHGQFAHRAAQAARQFVESHFDQPLAGIFRGAGRACSSTHGVVMAVTRVDWGAGRLTFASVGNVESRVSGAPTPPQLIVRRGIVGLNTPNPIVTEHPWGRTSLMVLHTDGVSASWRWEDFPAWGAARAEDMAWQLLRSAARDDDDATVVVVKSGRNQL